MDIPLTRSVLAYSKRQGRSPREVDVRLAREISRGSYGTYLSSLQTARFAWLCPYFNCLIRISITQTKGLSSCKLAETVPRKLIELRVKSLGMILQFKPAELAESYQTFDPGWVAVISSHTVNGSPIIHSPLTLISATPSSSSVSIELHS